MTVDITTLEFEAEDKPSENVEEFDKPLNVSEDLDFRAGFGTPLDVDLDGFNEYGVRENRSDEGDLEYVDVVYEAMQPGPPENRNGVRITSEFLQRVASKEYEDSTPYMLGHSEQPLDEIGKLQRVWFDQSVGKLMVMNRVFNTGAATHDEVVNRLTFEPPTMTDGSIGFGNQYEAVENEAGEPELIDGEIREFSTTPFPGGYDDGGLGVPNSAFAEAAAEAADYSAHGDGRMEPNEEQLNKVYSEWESMVNMDNEQMERWDDHPCADGGVDDSENTRDNTLMLMGTPKEGWSQEHVEVANRAIDFMATQMEKIPDNPAEGGEGTCPGQWATSLLNHGHNPLDGFPAGNPQFSDFSVEVIEFDDEGTDTVSPSEDSAGEHTETISF
jgi:hypothetical protein